MVIYFTFLKLRCYEKMLGDLARERGMPSSCVACSPLLSVLFFSFFCLEGIFFRTSEIPCIRAISRKPLGLIFKVYPAGKWTGTSSATLIFYSPFLVFSSRSFFPLVPHRFDDFRDRANDRTEKKK